MLSHLGNFFLFIHYSCAVKSPQLSTSTQYPSTVTLINCRRVSVMLNSKPLKLINLNP